MFLLTQDIVVPRLDTMFDFSASGQVTFKDQSLSNSALDAVGELTMYNVVADATKLRDVNSEEQAETA
jgi:hypothetical protein